MNTTNNNNVHEKDNSEKIEKLNLIRSELSNVVIGQEKLVDRMLIAILCNGHILLEGVPGLAKTTLISALSKTLNLDFKRIQFTPDLLPSDLIGSRIYNQQSNSFYVHKGPVFTNFLLADEINRSPAKVQSALLEAMQERQVTIGDETQKLSSPFFVMATQNPIEQEGTYQLPEAQVDRFLFKTIVSYPAKKDELKIVDLVASDDEKEVKVVAGTKDIGELQDAVRNVFVDDSIKAYVIDIVQATRYPDKKIGDEYKSLFAFGASPRASIGLFSASKAVAFMAGRNYVIPEDVKEIAFDVLRHRIIPTYEAEAENVTQDDLVKIVLDNVIVP